MIIINFNFNTYHYFYEFLISKLLIVIFLNFSYVDYLFNYKFYSLNQINSHFVIHFNLNLYSILLFSNESSLILEIIFLSYKYI